MTGWMETGMPETIRIVGDKGVLDLHDLKGGELAISFDGERRNIDCGTLPHTHWGLFANFNDHLLKGTPLLCDGTEGRKSTVLMDALLRIDKPGEWMPVRYEEPR
jgi:predicted dehydrogenase